MNELRALSIARKLREFCDFFAQAVKDHDLFFDEGTDQQTALREIEGIRALVTATKRYTIAFVGEYSSGKTTLINLLTNGELFVGTDVTTQHATKIEWNDMIIIDTPGLGSGNPEHDRITEDWLAGADLLVYVLTTDLFTNQSGQRFNDMLDKYKRDHELMLVLNMIDQEGNPISVYENSLQEVVAPRLLQDYFPVFMSAKYKQQGLDMKYSEEERDWFEHESRFGDFLKNLDGFILNRGERARLTTPLTRLQRLTTRIRFKNEFDKEQALLDWRIRSYESALTQLRTCTNDLKEALYDRARGTAGEIFFALDNSSNDFQEYCTDQVRGFEGKCKESVDGYASRISQVFDDLRQDGIEIEQSALSSEVAARIQHSERLKKVFIALGPIKGGSQEEWTFADIKDRFREIHRMSSVDVLRDWDNILDSTNFVDAVAKLVGKVDKKLILDIGHFLGKKFRPWEASKIAAIFAKAAPILNVAAAGYEVYSHYNDKKKEEEAARQITEFKAEVRGLLEGAASDLVNAVNANLTVPCQRIVGDALELTRKKKKELLAYSSENQALNREFEEKRDQCFLLYDAIYGNDSPS